MECWSAGVLGNPVAQQRNTPILHYSTTPLLPYPEGPSSERGVAGELRVGQPCAAILCSVSANGFRRREQRGAIGGNDVILIHAVAAHTDGADQHAVAVERERTGEYCDAVRQIW